ENANASRARGSQEGTESTEWATLARDIFHGGWENHRGAIEARLTAKGKFGEPLTFGWLGTITSVNACHMALDRPELYMFRRMQLAEQAALKQAADPSLVYKDSFLKACEEYNAFGSAVSNKKIRVDQHKQKLFINRVMFLHSLAVGRVSVQTTTAVRLTASQWEAEVELACAGGYVMDKMSQARDAENKPVFSESVIKNCWGRFIEGDFVDDLSTHVASADPTFDPCQSLMWIECSPEKKEAGLVDSALGMTEKKITKLESAQHVAAWESDTLKLAKDATVCAKLLKQAVNNERTDRLARITHIKEQNKIGAGIVTSFAAKNCHHVTLACPDAEGQLSEFLSDVFSHHGIVLVWVDMMKLGRIQNKQLDDLASRVKKVLSRKSSHTMAFVMAPHVVSSKTLNSNIRGEVRRIEDKFDAKGMVSYPVSVRCNPPPSAKSMSDVQESAQMLAGEDLPKTIIESVLAGFERPANLVGIVNVTPYDAHLESVAVHWQIAHGKDSPLVRSFSISDQCEEVLFSQRRLGNKLLQEL
ncbi:Uncharacterized protein SCF082_LOCUS22731, partial [Durusdinium trenchii]